MKLSHLSLAILSAIALAGCGGSGSDSNHVADPNPGVQPDIKPEPAPGAEDADKGKEEAGNENIEKNKVIDPTQTGVVGKLDTNTEESVGITQYLRGKKSKFDLVNNPNEETVATSILGVTLNEQNPRLTNIALAKYVDKNGIIRVVQYLGNEKVLAHDIEDLHSLQQQNKHNVAVPLDSGLTNTEDTADAKTAIKLETVQEQLGFVDKLIAGYEHNSATLKTTDKENKAKLEKLRSELAQIQNKLEDDSNPYAEYYIVRQNDKNLKWGDFVTTSSDVMNYDSTAITTVQAPSAFDDKGKPTGSWTGPQALGLVGMQFEDADVTGLVDVQGTEEKSLSSTRIFGRNYNIDGEDVPTNSYRFAKSILLEQSNSTNFAAPEDNTLPKIQKAYNDATRKNLTYTLAVKPMKLDNVQYGRVTGNLDLPALTKEEKEGKVAAFKRAEFRNKGDQDAVDTYFYRGPNATTIAQMNALPSGKEFVYQGHALMYGIDNSFHGNQTTQVPNAFGSNGKYGVGNFVQATFKVDANRVENGRVYNVWSNEDTANAVEDTLVTFDGNVFGNTVLGEAQRIYNKSDKADFRASFFGANAEEMGGSFNSTTWQERYGAKGDVWGGVFGAKRFDLTPAEELSNEQLGDVPNLTDKINRPTDTNQK